MKIDGVIILDEVYDLDPDDWGWVGDPGWVLPSEAVSLQVTFPGPISDSFRRILFGPPSCAYNQPPLLPRPEWHVETVTINPFARFGYMKQKVRRMARERFNRARS